MRFVLVDRVLAFEPGVHVEVLKNVSATEDVFDDHFPGYPVLPGALVVEVFDQAVQLLMARTHGFASVGELTAVSRASFRHLVRPGDQVRARCVRRGGRDDLWTLDATAAVDGRSAATARLEFAVAEVGDDPERRRRAERLREMWRVLSDSFSPLAAALPS